MKKALLWTLGIFLVLAMMAFVFRNWILKTTFEQAVSRLTGFETRIDNLRYDLPATLEITGLTIHNPQDFQNKIFAHVPQIYVDLSLEELLRREKTHLRTIKLDIQEVNIEKNAQGATNVSRLSSVGGGAGKPKPARSGAPEQAAGPGMPFLLDRLELTLRTVTFQDFSAGKLVSSGVMPEKVSVDMKIDKQVFENILEPQALVYLVLLKIFYGTTFGNLMELSPAQLESTLTGVLDSGTKLLTGTAERVTEKAGHLVSGAADTAVQRAQGLLSAKPLAGAKDSFTDTAQAAKGQISGFMNKLKSNLE